MPHLRIEYSANLAAKPDWRALFADLHGLLQQLAGIATANCKSRASCAEHFLIGDGTTAEAFVHLDLQLLEGRSAELLGDIGQAALSCLEQHCQAADDAQPLQLTVHVGELVVARYFKSSHGGHSAAKNPG